MSFFRKVTIDFFVFIDSANRIKLMIPSKNFNLTISLLTAPVKKAGHQSDFLKNKYYFVLLYFVSSRASAEERWGVLTWLKPSLYFRSSISSFFTMSDTAYIRTENRKNKNTKLSRKFRQGKRSEFFWGLILKHLKNNFEIQNM